MKILLPVDGSDHTKHMLAWLAAHDEWLGNKHEYTVLTVVPPIPPHAMEFLDPEFLRNYDKDQAEAVFKPIQAFIAQHQLKATYIHRLGNAGDEIATEAGNGHDLVIMGSHGRGAFAGLVMGSTATRVLAACRTPVLLIR
ncbi:universal stress protein [Aquabacterium sp.]|uniref:universal stress protein n=1 Tax=Aquabacterium sp. TaxID=1872578 RepID=UPI0035B02795